MDLKFVDLRTTQYFDNRHAEAVASGVLVKLTPEIAVDAAAFARLPPWEQARARAFAFGMSADRATLCGKSAARVMGLSVLGYSQQVEFAYVESTSGLPKLRRTEFTLQRRSWVRSDEVAVYSGVRVTKVSRTCIDIARYFGVTEGVAAMDSALRLFNPNAKDLIAERISLMKGFAHISRAKAALELATGKAESALESLARVDLVAWDNPAVFAIEEQVEITLPDGYRARVDLLVNGWIVIEVDGESKYDGRTYGTPTAEVLRKERIRENQLQRMGYVVIRFTFPEVGSGAQDSVLRRKIAQLLATQGSVAG